VLVQCYIRAGTPSVSVPAGWTSFASNIDAYDTQYLIYKLYSANSTIAASIALTFNSGGISFAVIQTIAYQGVSGFDAGPSATSSTNSSTANAPAISTTTNGDTILWFYSAMGPVAGTISSVSGGTIQSRFDYATAPINYQGCEAIAALQQVAPGTEGAQNMTCSTTENWYSGIVVALAQLP
jgi:hypothetical protein